MFEGLRLMMGFASVMYLDSREGTAYGNNLSSSTTSIRGAFFSAASRYQVQRTDGDSIARCLGYTDSKDQKISNTQGPLASTLWYKNYNGGYSIIETQTIPHTGETLWW